MHKSDRQWEHLKHTRYYNDSEVYPWAYKNHNRIHACTMGNGRWPLPFSEPTMWWRDNTHMQITMIPGIIIPCIAQTKC